MNPNYPVYIVSKGRWETRKTSKALEKLKVPYHIVVEPQEYDMYSSVIDESKILVLPFSNLGQGSIPARNWIWEHAISVGSGRHWILDDNIAGFSRYNRNMRIPVTSGTIFRCAEDFTDRYENIAISGFQYRSFANSCRKRPPFLLNTRIYSCMLIQNNLPFRWRGLYNEDTDLCLRILKNGWCTVLFMAFLQDKAKTMSMRGGNTDELYLGDGRLKMAQALVEQHQDIVKLCRKYNRWQHLVNYKPFKKNKLTRKNGLKILNKVNNYGMILVET